MSNRSLSYLADLHPSVAASVAEDWANDARYLIELSIAADRAYQNLSGPCPMMLTMPEYARAAWTAWKTAQFAYSEAIREAAGTRARRIAYAFDWYKDSL